MDSTDFDQIDFITIYMGDSLYQINSSSLKSFGVEKMSAKRADLKFNTKLDLLKEVYKKFENITNVLEEPLPELIMEFGDLIKVIENDSLIKEHDAYIDYGGNNTNAQIEIGSEEVEGYRLLFTLTQSDDEETKVEIDLEVEEYTFFEIDDNLPNLTHGEEYHELLHYSEALAYIKNKITDYI